MSYAQYLRDLLRPLGVYDLEATFNGGELDAQGECLDRAMDWIEEVRRETCLMTAESWGVERVAQLFARRPVADDPKKLSAALAALLRIGGDSFTLAAMNDTIAGCGIPAEVKELGRGQVSVSFPGVAGEPRGFQGLKKIVEDILPAHLGIVYDFWFLTWAELEKNVPSWRAIEEMGLSWAQLETFVEYL